MSPFRDSAAGVLQVRPEMGMFLNGTGGSSGSFASSADHADYRITLAIDLRAAVALNDYTHSVNQDLVSRLGAAPNRSYSLGITTTGLVQMFWSADGTATTGNKLSTVAVAPGDRQAILVRATLDVDNGA